MVSAMSSLSFHLDLLLLFSSLLVPMSSHSESRMHKKYVALFVFGDSIYDPGNNNFLNVSIYFKANYPPYGETFFKYPTGRFCDGRIIPDFLAMDAKLPLWKPYLQPGPHEFTHGANFASAGGGVANEIVPGLLMLGEQLSYFKKVVNLLRRKLGGAEVKKLLTNAVYLYSIGGVDYLAFNNVNNATELERQGYVNTVIGNITKVLKEVYEIGGRKFALQNIGPLGCTPGLKQLYNLSSNDCVEQLDALAKLHNNALSNVAMELENQLFGFKYLIFDYYNSLGDRIKNPTKYGFKVGDIACCGTGTYRGLDCGTVESYELCDDPSEYVFFDGGHTTEAANSQLAELIWNGAPNVTSPLNLKQLLELTIEISLTDDAMFIDE